MKVTVDTEHRNIIVPNQWFVSTPTPPTPVAPPLMLCPDGPSESDPIQKRCRATKYQVSPDLQHVLFAFEVKPVSSITHTPPPHPPTPAELSRSSSRTLICLSPQIYQHSFMAKYIIYSLETQ